MPADKSRRLRFSDLPDVLSARNPATNTQRKTLEINDHRMEKILADNKFTYVLFLKKKPPQSPL